MAIASELQALRFMNNYTDNYNTIFKLYNNVCLSNASMFKIIITNYIIYLPMHN